MSSQPILTKECYTRFKGLPWFEKMNNAVIFIGGAGGIGSHLAFQLARTGARLYVVDMDTVGEENLAGQLYGKDDIGKSKVEALSDVIHRLCDEADNVVTANVEIREDELPGGPLSMLPYADVVCVGFDNLKARRIVYERWKKEGKAESLFVDGRLTAESGQVFVVQKNNHDDVFLGYEETYFSDAERTELPCTMKATTHCGAMIASLMVSQITNWFNNITEGTMERTLCNIEFHLPLGMIELSQFKVKNYVAEMDT